MVLMLNIVQCLYIRKWKKRKKKKKKKEGAVVIVELAIFAYTSFPVPAPIAQLVECLLMGTGGHGFDPGPRHTKVVKMVLAAPRLALRFTG